jgi:hypothetical protein
MAVVLGFFLSGCSCTQKTAQPQDPNVTPTDPFIGIWKMNPGKSKFSYPAPKSFSIIVEARQDGFQCLEELVNAEGKTIRRRYACNYDGKDYPIEGDPDMDTISFGELKGNVGEYVIKKGGSEIIRGQSVVSGDEKTWIDVGQGKGAGGMPFTFSIFMEKQ